jgi:hypothetical protein
VQGRVEEITAVQMQQIEQEGGDARRRRIAIDL